LNLKVLDFVYYGFDAPLESDYEISSSGVFLLSTSHLAWHSYPEDGRVHFSLSTCGPKIEVSDLNKQIELSYSKVTGIEHYPCVINPRNIIMFQVKLFKNEGGASNQLAGGYLTVANAVKINIRLLKTKTVVTLYHSPLIRNKILKSG